MSETYSEVVQTARDYYNSEDADNFYFHIWGGEDIHIGLYERPDDEIATASRRTVAHMAGRLGNLGAETRLLDIGAGYGGAARYLAQEFGCHVTALNLSEAENARNRQLTKSAGLADRINVVDGSFEDLPFDDSAFDVVWSQDSILHSGERESVIAEVARVLRPGGRFLFTDIMESGVCSKAQLQPVLDRIHLESLGSVSMYCEAARRNGLSGGLVEDLTPQLVQHYSRVRDELMRRRSDIAGKVSPDYIDRMLVGLENWVKAGREGCLTWGILDFRRQAM